MHPPKVSCDELLHVSPLLTFFFPQCILVLAFTLCLLRGISADNSSSSACASHTAWTSTSSDTYTVKINYVTSSSSNIEVSVDGCSADSQDSTLSSFVYSLVNGVNDAQFTISQVSITCCFVFHPQ